MDINAWWSELGTAQHVFYVIAFIGSGALLVQLLLQIIGIAGADFSLGDVDSGLSADHASGIGYLSVRTVIAFLTGFGWGGAIAMSSGAPVLIAALVALIVGLVMVVSVVWMMGSMLRLNASGSLDYANAIGSTGMTYIPIAAQGAAGGQVEIQVQGRLCVVAAITRGVAIPARTTVKVSALADPTTLIVEPIFN